MSPFPAHTRVVLPGVVCLILCGQAGALAAQEGPPANSITWEVGSPKAGWCIHFLMEPKTAVKDLARGFRLVLAREAAGLPRPVSRLITEEPEFADWAPAELCTYIAEAIWVDGRRFDRGDSDQPVAVLYWGVAAASAGGGLPDAGGLSLSVLATNSSGIQRAMEMRTVPIDKVQIEAGRVAESEDDQIMIKLDGATITFTGHPRQDSTLITAIRTRTAGYMGNNRALWGVTFTFHPEDVSAMAGALRIVGKRGLAKALDRSPIRLLSPILSGGRGTVTFTR
jgi:hypothetical protein